MSALPGVIALLVGAGLIAAPWWSSTLGRADYPLVLVLGVIFAGFGAYTSLPARFGRSRTLVFGLAMGAFGAVCAALVLTPLSPDPDGTYRIGGIAGFRTDMPMPLWARIVAGFFALVCLGTGALGLWSVLRGLVRGERPDS